MNRFLLILFLFACHFVLAQSNNNLEHLNTTLDKNILSTVGDDKLLQGINLGQIPIKILFDSVGIFNNTKEIFFSGKVLNKQTEEPLSNLKISIGKIDSSKGYIIIRTSISTITDSSGLFKIHSKVKFRDKLLFAEIGFFSQLFNIDKLFYKK